MRALTCLLLAAATLAAADADRYFEVGLTYLKQGQFTEARSAFAESLIRAPGEPVSMALLAVAAAAEGYQPRHTARIVRAAYRRLPRGKAFGFSFHRLLPATTLPLLERDLERDGSRAAKELLAFLQTHDADPAVAPALDRLMKKDPADALVQALDAERTRRAAARPIKP